MKVVTVFCSLEVVTSSELGHCKGNYFSQNETQVPSSKQEENETNWRNREKTRQTTKNTMLRQGSRSREEKVKKQRNKLV
jgi:hypothetical protein